MSFQRFFRNHSIQETSFFDEGPRISEATLNLDSEAYYVNSSSIDTTLIDGWRQGVEITQQKHWDAGFVKIHAGEPGHALKQNRFGMDKNIRQEPTFEELDFFNPVHFLRSQEFSSPEDIITFPMIVGDNDQIESYILDGVIEPLLIREVASFTSIEAPFVSRTIKGGLMGGNTDNTFSSDQVMTVDVFDTQKQQIPYLDLVDLFNGSHPSGYFYHEKATLKPFSDRRLVRNIVEDLNDPELQSALSIMSGTTDNYVSFEQRSATSGWTYDNALKGTDSLAFGGQLY